MFDLRLATILKAEFAKDSARRFDVATQAELEDFVPCPGDCHGNARHWVERNPAYRVIEGWVAADPEWYFLKHSIVEDGAGRLICVTYGGQGAPRDNRIVIHRPEWASEPFSALDNEVRMPLPSGTIDELSRP